MADVAWWQSGVFYQIYPRSFADANGDGVGDLEGIRRHLDHVLWLGVDALWLSPVYRSPMSDFGYDVSDHRDIDPVFGDLADLDRLIEQVHADGKRIVLDWVPNHTSDRHPWFAASRSSRADPRRDWYYWRDDQPGGNHGRPNNWIAAFGGPAWTWDERTGQWYLHLFLPEQPDLNWGNPAVEAALHKLHLVLNFSLLRQAWDPAAWAASIAEAEKAFAVNGAWPAWMLSNHDAARHRSRYGGSEARARAAALVLLTLRGTPFLYAGEELGLLDAEVPEGRRVDPGGRDGCRSPLPWDASPGHGWADKPWLPFAEEAGERNVAAQRSDETSILHLYRRLLDCRRRSAALRQGALQLVGGPAGTLAYERRAGDDVRFVAVNFGDEPAEGIGTAGDWVVELDTDREHDAHTWNGRLGALEGVLLAPL